MGSKENPVKIQSEKFICMINYRKISEFKVNIYNFQIFFLTFFAKMKVTILQLLKCL